jgi:hypothetical protein
MDFYNVEKLLNNEKTEEKINYFLEVLNKDQSNKKIFGNVFPLASLVLVSVFLFGITNKTPFFTTLLGSDTPHFFIIIMFFSTLFLFLKKSYFEEKFKKNKSWFIKNMYPNYIKYKKYYKIYNDFYNSLTKEESEIFESLDLSEVNDNPSFSKNFNYKTYIIKKYINEINIHDLIKNRNEIFDLIDKNIINIKDKRAIILLLVDKLQLDIYQYGDLGINIMKKNINLDIQKISNKHINNNKILNI